jgi:hypothetical protein
LIQNIFTSLFIIFTFCPEEIGKKENSQNCKHNKKLNENYDPNLSPPGWHIDEAIIIEAEYPVNKE